MKKILSLVLSAVLLLSLAACTPGETLPENSTVNDGATVGEGSVSFPLTIVDKEGNEIHVTVNTDQEMVGEALFETGLAVGSQGDYGLYISHVNGIKAVYEEDGVYWAFYINGEYAQTGVDLTPIAEGESYMLKVE